MNHIKNKTQKKAFIGDIHGCIDELKILFQRLKEKEVEEIWHVGDLVDRGPDSGAVVEFCREKDIHGVLGNHESTLLPYRQKFNQKIPKEPERNRTCYAIRSEADWNYLETLPPLHVFEEEKIILVHGGIYSHLPLYAQPKEAIIRLQLIHLDQIGITKWFDRDRNGTPEKFYRDQGWIRWYEIYDLPYHIIYGHSVYKNISILQGKNRGKIIGLDTGVCFGGPLSAVIYPDFECVQVPAKRIYCPLEK